MSISSTRRVSSSTSAPNKAEFSYNRSGPGGNFIEHIDTTNSVLVGDRDSDNPSKNKQQQSEERDSSENISTTNKTYVPNAIEAVASGGFYDYDQDLDQDRENSETKVGVYGSNQSILQNSSQDKLSLNYLKRFYERNGIIAEVDELV